ncbi:MAG: polysaccharide deacetylase [Flavobacteriaceae bacterium]|nr:polysaccharide deacetylase [Flavobacteriaceae bacterium]
MKKGTLVISLDFELVWGLFDHIIIQDKITYFENTLKVIPRLLSTFEKNNIHVTWATVGMLFNENWEEWYANIPVDKPTYENHKLNPYHYGEQHSKSGLDRFFFAPQLIKAIQSVKGQEIGSHTYSHYYCLEKGQTQAQFDADLQKAVAIANKFSIKMESLVFPRNQFNETYLEVCQKNQIKTVRINPTFWYWNANIPDTIFTKLARTSDAYLPLSKKSYKADSIQPSPVVGQAASRFLRPQHSQTFLNTARVHRIKNEIIQAAKNGEVYHLWWHPHNFGIDPEGAMKALHDIIQVFQQCQQTYGMESLTMRELADPYLTHS